MFTLLLVEFVIHFSVIALPHLEGLRILKGLESDVSSSYEKYFFNFQCDLARDLVCFLSTVSSSLQCLPLPLKK